MSGTPAPALELELDRTLPGWVVHAAALLLPVLCAVLMGGGTTIWVVTAVVCALMVYRPDWATAAAVPVLVAVWLVGRPDVLGSTAGTVTLAALLLASHLTVRVAATATHVTLRSRVEVAVLGRSVASVLAVQVLVQLLLLAVVVLRAGVAEGGLDWLRLVAVPAALVLVLLVIPREWVAPRPRPVRR